MVPHEPVEICGKLWISQAVQDMGLDTDLQLDILSDIQFVPLDFRAVVLFCGAWPWNILNEKGLKESQTTNFSSKCDIWGVFGGHFSFDESGISSVEQLNPSSVDFRF